MIDGLRPDRLKQAADAGWVPEILKALFLDRGVEMNSYTYRSLTLPSWTSWLTGKNRIGMESEVTLRPQESTIR